MKVNQFSTRLYCVRSSAALIATGALAQQYHWPDKTSA